MSTASGQRNAPADASKKPPLSCAECRRLKLKCNRVWPCFSCQKRGLADICPAGSLPTRPRQKPPQPTPQHVAERVHELQARVNELETALENLQATVSDQPHPLLKLDTVPYLQRKLMRKAALEKVQQHGLDDLLHINDGEEDIEKNDETDEIVASLGTLKIAPDGRSTFFGPTAVSEGLSIEDNTFSSCSNQLASLPVDIVVLSQCFPFASPSAAVTALQEQAKSYLPPLKRAETLCASFFAYATFVFYPVPEDEDFETLFARLYGTRRSYGQPQSLSHREMHGVGHQWHLVPAEELSMFFCILALGALTDLSAEPFNAEAETYYQISRALMTTENMFTEPTIASVQVASLASYYEGLRSKGNSSRNCWTFMMLANKIAHIMGLHRDHSMFGLDEREIQRRRHVFWEVHSIDMIQSLALGRPISTPASAMDTQMPVDTHATTSPTGEPEESYYSWKSRFCAEILTVLGDHVLRVKSPNYTHTLTVDSRMRRFKSTYGQDHPKAESCSNPFTAAQIQFMLGTRETCMLYIHRGYFAHAISTDPQQPEMSKYGRSVTAAYESAGIIVQGMQNFIGSHAMFAARIWFLWNHLLSASFVLGSIITRAPCCSLAAPASAQLDVIDQILKQAAVYGGRAEYMLPVINNMRTKGHNARMDFQAGSLTRTPGVPDGTLPEVNDELAVIGGQTRVFLSRQSSMSPREQDGVGTASSLPSTSVDIPQAFEHTPAIPESYPQSGNMYQMSVPSPQGQGQDSYWPDGDYMPHSEIVVPQFGLAEPQVVDNTLSAYALSQQELGHHGNSAYKVDTLTGLDGGSNLWQTLVRDLGVGL